MQYLIIGGTGELGAPLIAKLVASGHSVHITGRQNPQASGASFHFLDLSNGAGLAGRIAAVLDEVGVVDGLIYAAGFYQEGRVTDLSEDQIYEMLNVGLIGAILTVRELLTRQGKLAEFVAITSTSQYTPRQLEILYTVSKSGLGMFANSLSLDGRVAKTLVAGPAGIKTQFHDGRDADTSTYTEPAWVAEEIIKALSGDFTYKYVRILRDPAHVEVQETR